MTAYRIANWDRLYENSETRKIKRLSWVPTRNKHDGLGFRLMVRDPRKVELFCAWNLILQIASKGEGKERGTLVRDGLPLSPDDLGMMTGYPPGIFKHGLEFFSNPKVAWLEEMRGLSGDSPEVSGDCPAEQNRTEQKEQKEQNNTAAEAAVIPYAEIIYMAYPRKAGRPNALRKINAALKKEDPAKLLERTKAYAAATVGMDPQFIPYPATWFCQERYNDDPATWNQTSGKHGRKEVDPTEGAT